MTQKRLQEEVVISEACATGLFWNTPHLFSFYPTDKINAETFLNRHWGFFFGFGRYMFEKGVLVFDDITVTKHVKELGIENTYEKYGGFETIKEIMQEVKHKEDNLDAYYADIKKYNLLQSLIGLFGEQVITVTKNYDYKRMTKDQLFVYWNDKVIKLGLDGDSKYDEHYLLQNLKGAIEEWSTNPAVGLPFFKSKKLTKITTGWDFGHVYIYGGFGGSGKTSFTFNKVVMSCIEKKEKLLVIANEQSVEEFKKMLIVTAMGNGTYEPIPRQRLNEGEFTDEEKEKLFKAAEWVEGICEGKDQLITFVFMENYVIDDVKKLIRYYANRGIQRVLIDTGKPSEGDASLARWERFTEDFKEIYKLARPNGGGLNLAVWVNVQLADTALAYRVLNEMALGDSKKIKNEASVVFMGRAIWDDEYSDGKHALKVTNYRYDPTHAFAEESGIIKESVTLSREKVYYLIFTSKNRRGQDNKTGQQVLVLEVSFNYNTWKEIGWTTVFDERKY